MGPEITFHEGGFPQGLGRGHRVAGKGRFPPTTLTMAAISRGLRAGMVPSQAGMELASVTQPSLAGAKQLVCHLEGRQPPARPSPWLSCHTSPLPPPWTVEAEGSPNGPSACLACSVLLLATFKKSLTSEVTQLNGVSL